MAAKFMQLVLTPAVLAAQERYFGKHQAVAQAPERDPFPDDEAAFIAARDSFYMATVSETGWPYIQHRGGPIGFVRVLDRSYVPATCLSVVPSRGWARNAAGKVCSLPP